MTARKLPAALTSYDLLKTFAVVFMIVDHVGYYFFPDENWFRVFGRFCVPVWFFLVGYAKSRDLGPRMWIGAAILVAGNVATGMSIFPMNILATMIAVRLLIDPVMERALRGASQFWAVTVMLTLIVMPTAMGAEYGALGVLMAVYGWLVRHAADRPMPQGKDTLSLYFLYACAAFLFFQQMGLWFGQAQFTVLSLGTVAVMGVLYLFRPAEYPRLTAALPGFLVKAVQFTGRRTLEIYVVHLLLFKVLAVDLQPDRFAWFDWKWFSPTGT